MSDGADLPALLAQGERAAFHGPPAAAVAALELAVVAARDADRTAELAGAAWLLGVALGAGGRYGSALTVLDSLLGGGQDLGPERRLFAALAASTAGSVHRQLGRHAAGRLLDQRGLELSRGVGEAGFDAHLGLSADAVGLGETETAQAELAAAAALVPDRAGEWWRQRVRLDWVRCEVALLTEDPAAAAEHAEAAVARAEQNRAPRHVAKGLLFLGVSRLQAGLPDPEGALRRAASLAEGLGCLPLVWPSRAVLGAMLADVDPAAGNENLAAARAVVLAIADDLRPDLRAEWLGRPDIDALLGA